MRNFIDVYEEIKNQEPRPRGFSFEKLINNVFLEEGTLIQPSYRERETNQQVDGAIEIGSRIFLLEVKWEKNATLAASKLYSFLGKISSKIEGTIGVFISHNTLDAEFIHAARAGIRQNCLIIHGEENILPILQGKVSFSNYVWFLFRKASSHGLVTSPVDELLSTPNFSNFPVKSNSQPQQSNDPWPIIYQSLIGKDSPKQFQGNLTSLASGVQNLTDKLISIVHVLERGDKDKLKLLADWCIDNLEEALVDSVIGKLNGSSWINLAKPDIESMILSRIDFSGKNINALVEKIVEFLENKYNDYDSENCATHILRPLWPYMNNSQKTSTAKAYLRIYCDTYRKAVYPQKDFSNAIYRIENKSILMKASMDVFSKEIADQKSREIPFLEDASVDSVKRHIVSNLVRQFKSAMDLLQISQRMIEKLYDEAP